MRIAKPILLGVALAVLATPVSAESINIDFGYPGNGPPSSYRAAGLPGYWHSIEATEWGLHYDLLDLHGEPTGVTVRQIGGTEIVEAPLGGAGQPAGSDEVLMGDALVTHTEVDSCLLFEGLENGTYEILTYAWMPNAPATQSRIMVDNTPHVPLVGGPWPGLFRENVTHSRHEVVVDEGWLQNHSGVPDGGDFGIGAAIDAVQIRRMVPEPPLFVERTALFWLAALDADSYDLVVGDLGTLRATGGDFIAATDACVANGAAGGSKPYASNPDPGEGEWFLVRGVNGAVPLTWNSEGASQAGDRDPQLDLAPAACD